MADARPPTLTRVRGVRLGHASDLGQATGTTAILFPGTARGAAEARGGAPGTLHTDALGPLGCFGILDAVFLTGGSLLGLDAERGIRRRVLEKGGGARVWGARDRMVRTAGAVLFDLSQDRKRTVDYDELGWRAADTASAGPVEIGSVGAGTGATVGKLLGRGHAMSGGIGSCSASLPGGFHVGALAAVNSVGNIVDPATGKIMAGTRSAQGGWVTSFPTGRRRGGVRSPPVPSRGTTLVVIATDLPLSRRDLGRLAQAGHDGIARCVVPAHMATDGDTVFAVSTTPEPERPVWPGGGREPYPGALADLVSSAGAGCVSSSILLGIRAARSRPGLPCAADQLEAGEDRRRKLE
jgi:L-aminopeptidase/D-esterase-like protein